MLRLLLRASKIGVQLWQVGSRWYRRGQDEKKETYWPHRSCRRSSRYGKRFTLTWCGASIAGAGRNQRGSNHNDKFIGDFAAMLKVSFPNDVPSVNQFGLIADMELPEFTLTRSNPQSVRNSPADCISVVAPMGKANDWQGERGGSGKLGKPKCSVSFQQQRQGV